MSDLFNDDVGDSGEPPPGQVPEPWWVGPLIAAAWIAALIVLGWLIYRVGVVQWDVPGDVPAIPD